MSNNYTILKDYDKDSLTDTINLLLEEGWDLRGDLHIVNMSGANEFMYLQPMQRWSEEDNNLANVVSGAD